MRRIFISDEVEAIALSYKTNLFAKHKRKDFIRPQDGLKKLEDDIIKYKEAWSTEWKKYADYVHNLRTHFDEILLLKPKQFKTYRNLYFGMLNKDQLTDKNWRGRAEKLSFSDQVVNLMHYKTVRSEDMITCVKKLGIKACVYCNAQYTNTVEVDGKDVRGRYELDHFLPKDEYPFLCISFYNLQPCCGSCNKWKSDDDVEFNLYTEDYTKIDPFTFEITPASIIKYMLRQDSEVLDIKLKSSDAALLANHEKRFHTEKLYQTYNDEIEEIVWKYKSFNSAFNKQLIARFKKLFPQHASRNDIIRFLFGFYLKPADVHKRPLTKVKQDVAKQLGMI